MVLTVCGRINNLECKDMTFLLRLLTVALNDMISEVEKVLHVVGGTGEISYAKNSRIQVPRRVDDGNDSDQLKKRNLYMDHFKEDFSTFLRLRSEELVAGGKMVLTVTGRRNNPEFKDTSFLWGLLNVALNDMISEGLVREADRNATNFPIYTPSMEELIHIIEIEGSFQLDLLETFDLSWDPYEYDADTNLEIDYLSRGTAVAKYIRAIADPLLDCCFDKEIIDDLFSRYAKIIGTHLNEKPKWQNHVLDLKLKE